MPRMNRFTTTKPRVSLWAMALACAATLPNLALAQQTGAPPAFRFGLTTGVVANSNRGFDAPSAGSTIEYTARLDFGITFATPVQELDISGDIGLRHVTGAESGALDTGLVEPNLSIGYTRQSRDARLALTFRTNELDVSSNTLEEIIGVPDPVLVTEEGTRRSTVFDTELELRRRARFGVTLSAGFTGLTYGDTVPASSLTDQDRFRLGALLRFDLTPSMRATLDFGYSTFEDFGTPEGVRETYSLNGDLRQDLRNGNISFQFGATATEDGDRYTLSAGRSVTTPLWEFSGTLGLTRDIQGDVLPTASLSLARALPDGSLSASFSQRVASGADDDEEQITSLSVTYAKQLNAITSFNASLSYSETDPTAAGASTNSFGTLGIGLQRSLTRGVQLDLGFQHRISEDIAGMRARDNRLSISLRRDLSARR